MKFRWLIPLALLCYVFFTIIFFPVRLLLPKIQEHLPSNVTIESIEGRWWNVKVTAKILDLPNIKPLNLQLQVKQTSLSLLWLMPKMHVEIKATPFHSKKESTLQTFVHINKAENSVVFNRMSATLDLSSLHLNHIQTKVKGTVYLNDVQLRIVQTLSGIKVPSSHLKGHAYSENLILDINQRGFNFSGALPALQLRIDNVQKNQFFAFLSVSGNNVDQSHADIIVGDQWVDVEIKSSGWVVSKVANNVALFFDLPVSSNDGIAFEFEQFLPVFKID